ncbi:MAG: dUTP diphosphatase [Hyphomicrobiales bacterium]|nr:dUTP diphosphatase [Hyphomicrobiales bacterium]
MTPARVLVQRLPHGIGLPTPAPQSADAAGSDLAAAVPENAPVTLEPGDRTLVPTGFAIALPAGYEGQVRPRSGLSLHHGITVLNAPGTIDADYRGEVKVVLINHGAEPFRIERGMRIAQLLIAPIAPAVFDEVADLPASERGDGGHGSTGLTGQLDRTRK